MITDTKFLDLANRQDLCEAWRIVLFSNSLKSTGSSDLHDHDKIFSICHILRLSRIRSTSAMYYTQNTLECGVYGDYPIDITLNKIEGHSHSVNICYFTKALGHISIQTNLIDLVAVLEETLKPILLQRLGDRYGI